LVVIAIIGILIALLLPAVQAAREAARRTQCKNHLKQIALGCLGHESSLKRFPTGGWGYKWTGDADRGTDWRQPGGWIYNIMPYIEQGTLHQMGAGLPQAQKYAAHLHRMTVPLSVLYCPSRRAAIAYPWIVQQTINASGIPATAGRTDYAANGGDHHTHSDYPTQSRWQTGGGWGTGPINTAEVENPPGQMTYNARTTFANVARIATGIVYTGSLIEMVDVLDGTSHTYLVGEKYLNPDNYATGSSPADDWDATQGDNHDISRWSGFSSSIMLPPLRDTPGYTCTESFGSAHANGFHMAFCDGSVHIIDYTIDPEIHNRLANRDDGMTIDRTQF
jgi:prepilin-type processing-associated H-X9-DG protein